MKFQTTIKATIAAIFLGAVISAAWWVPQFELLAALPDSTALRKWFVDFGPWGPAAVIGLMTLAILVSPLPSAPIALASGAIYGHFWGALYVLASSEIGAVAAFGLTRFLGFDLLRNWIGPRLNEGLVGSQNFLMGTVFVSRLLPFISFDIVSYAAGLTTLSFWRFAVATLAGVVPASFLLAHFGQELVADEMNRILIAIILLGALTASPLLVKLIKRSESA